MTSGSPIFTQWDRSKTVAENAREKMPELAGQFIEEGNVTAGLDAPPERLHPFRLLTKRFRYILESFEDYYGPGLKLRIEALKRLQDLLGAISDCLATEKLIRKRRDITAADRERLELRLRKITHRRTAAFRSHWKKEFAPQARERWWVGYLRQARKQR